MKSFITLFKSSYIPFLLLILFTFSCQSLRESEYDKSNSLSKQKNWEYASDSNYVLKNPDRYAWELFRAVNWPADTINFLPDTTKKLGDAGWVVWQTWKTAPEVYLPNGHKPKGWLDKDFGDRSIKYFSPFSINARLSDISKDPTFGLEEVVLNKSTFEYIVSNKLYNTDGQLAIYNSTQEIDFPLESIELKVKWRVIPDTPYEKARYHWQYVNFIDGKNKKAKLYGIVSIHITSRVLKKWLWATFEHIDNRSQKHPGDDGWLLPTKDRFGCNQFPYDCERAPVNFGLEGTKWEYFLLRGTQTDYIDENGDPSLLANSNVERGFQLSSSCITCHSLATIGPAVKPGQMSRINFVISEMKEDSVVFGGKGYVGLPDQKLFDLKGGKKMKRGDFVWSLIRSNWYKADSNLIFTKK